MIVLIFWSFLELNYGNNRFFARKSEESISLVESVDIPARVDRVSHYGCRKSEKGGNEKDFFKNRRLSFHFIRVTPQTIDDMWGQVQYYLSENDSQKHCQYETEGWIRFGFCPTITARLSVRIKKIILCKQIKFHLNIVNSTALWRNKFDSSTAWCNKINPTKIEVLWLFGAIYMFFRLVFDLMLPITTSN